VSSRRELYPRLPDGALIVLKGQRAVSFLEYTMAIKDYLICPVVTLIAREFDYDDGPIIRKCWQLTLPDYTVVRRFCLKPLTDGAQALLRAGFNPSTFLRLISWLSLGSYNSNAVALSGRLWKIAGKPELVSEWNSKPRYALPSPTILSLRERVWGERFTPQVAVTVGRNAGEFASARVLESA
jgi:hypothetical protein